MLLLRSWQLLDTKNLATLLLVSLSIVRGSLGYFMIKDKLLKGVALETSPQLVSNPSDT
jgi:hypothetical protein